MNSDSVKIKTYQRKGKEIWKIHCYQMNHSVPCNSYGIHLVSNKLKDEYKQIIDQFNDKEITKFIT